MLRTEFYEKNNSLLIFAEQDGDETPFDSPWELFGSVPEDLQDDDEGNCSRL